MPEQNFRVLRLLSLAGGGQEVSVIRAGDAEDLVTVTVKLLELGPQGVLDQGLLRGWGSEHLQLFYVAWKAY